LFFWYQILVFLSLPLIKFSSFFDAKIKLQCQGQKHTLRQLKTISRNQQQKCVWIHCASLGEFELARPLIEAIKENSNAWFIAITFFSSSGYEVQKNYTQADWLGYLPFDERKSIKNFLTLLKPDLTLFVKYEFWPNTLDLLKENSIKTFSLCGRFYPSQFLFKPYGKWVLDLVRKLDGFMVVDQQSEQLLVEHGFKNISCVGDLRMDRVLSNSKEVKPIFEIESFLNGEKCFVAGSTWPEDYPLFLNYLIDYTSTKIIIAPHEVNSNTVSKLKTIINKEIAVWSTFNSAQDEDKRILVIDSVGLLAQIYQYAHLAYVGGGMGNKGLHNILEPVVFGVPVFVGKNFQNFKEAQELVQKKGVFSVKNEAEFISIYETLSEEKYNLIQSINRNYINQHSGATKKTLSFLAPHLRL
tara:strand:- start:3486 stop:4724 length:1239 start_codon:yes stop_codon:yes gene_type:complete